MTDQGLSGLLIDLYDCPTNRGKWPVVLDQVCRSVGARCAAVQWLARGNDRATIKWAATDSASAADPGHDNVFISGDHNPRLRSGAGLRLRGSKMFLRDRDIFESGNRELRQLHKGLADIGLGTFMSAGIRVSDTEVLVLALHRDVNNDGDFSQADEAYLATLMPHLRQTIVLSDRIDGFQRHITDLQQAANHMRCGLVLCDADAGVSWCNRAAQNIIAKGDRIRIRGNRLTAGSLQATTALRRLIAGADSSAGSAKPVSGQYLLLGDSADLMALQVLAVPLERTAGQKFYRCSPNAGNGRVMLLFGDPTTSPLLPTEVIAYLFGLSPTESRLTAAMCRGLTVNEYAASQGVSVGTARYQLKQIFAKTQTTRQADLVMRVCMSIAAQAVEIEGAGIQATGRQCAR